jgi:UDP-MurNAc hydroxylase
VTYYGQACTLIEAAGRKILTDPWLTEGAYLGTWFHTHVLEDAGLTPETMPKDIDYIFISHEHEDHLDPETLRHFDPNIPVLICRFPTPKFRDYLRQLGLRNIIERPSGDTLKLGDGLEVTIYGTAEYTNDSAIVVRGDGCTVFNETDCKLGYADLVRLGTEGIDIGFYMFSGANWYPMMYDYPVEVRRAAARRRRSSLLRGLVQRVKLTRPRLVVPAAGPCTVLDPELLWLNSPEDGIFIDPDEAVAAVNSANLGAHAVNLAATDVWDSRTGIEHRAPAAFRLPRQEYVREAAARHAHRILTAKAAEPPAQADLPARVHAFFDEIVGAQSPELRRRIGARLALQAHGPHGGAWTIDFTTDGPAFTREGISPDWTYKLETEDRVLYPFVTRTMPFFEDLLLSMRVRLARRPDVYNEPLYHFLYEPDSKKLQEWYAAH